MTIPFWCLLAALVLIYLPKIPLSMAMAKAPGGYDNKTPREQQAKLEGWGKRAAGAHANAFEAFGTFAAAVFVAHLGHGSEKWSSILSIAFVALRAVYPVLYIANIDKARSFVWGLGALCTVGLFLLPAFG
ncbi:MAG TPA: MAPEG family protein [Polyangiaceae bacterium]